MKGIPVALAFLWMACNNGNETEDTITNSAPIQAAPQAPQAQQGWSGCYRAVQGRDTIWLQLTVQDSSVTGTMQYDNHGIDGSIGSIEASIQQNRVTGFLRFFSEGMWSVRQVIFENRAGTLLQADTKEMEYKKDTAFFAQPASVSWDEQRPFVRIPCSERSGSTLPQ